MFVLLITWIRSYTTILCLYRRPSGIDKEFFIQLFVEPQKDEPAINTERLLYKMFQEQNINFAKVC